MDDIKKKAQLKYYQLHKEKRKAYSKAYYQGHKEEHRVYCQKYNQQWKEKVLTYYGNGKPACVKCGFNDIRALSVDHLNNDGYEHRKKVVRGSWFYRRLVRQGYPKGYQTLCMNCQFIKRAEKK